MQKHFTAQILCASPDLSTHFSAGKLHRPFAVARDIGVAEITADVGLMLPIFFF
jgi:hypothetical protein